MIRILLFIVLLSSLSVLALSSCSKKSTFDAAMLTGKSLEQYDVIAIIANFESSPMILIKDVRIDGNVLFFTIEYEGACDKEEVFECAGLEQLNNQIFCKASKTSIQTN